MKSFAKNPRLEKPYLLEMARCVPRPCMLRVPGTCITGCVDTSCCACHGNSSEWNKGLGMKAHDFFSVWGCSRCHTWLDSSYSACYGDKDDAFRAALHRQIEAWAQIAVARMAKPKEIEAARWAIDHLITRGYAMPDPVLYATPVR